jgi:cystathionine beta-lyase
MKNRPINFDEIIDRNEVATLKFDKATMQDVFGSDKLWPAWVADMDFRAAPAIIDALTQRLEHGVFGYENSLQELPEAISRWCQTRYDWSFPPEQIQFTPRTLNSIAVLIELFSNKGDGVIVQPPVFYDFKLIIRSSGRKLIKNSLMLQQQRYQIDFDDLEQKAQDPANKILILCNPHNPVGRAWTREELTRIADICARNDVFIIADEIHGDISYGQCYTPLASVNAQAADISASCISPVKSFNLAGLANSMIVIGNDENRQRCADWYNRMEINKNNVFCNAAMLAAYTEGEDWLKQVTDYLWQNIELLRTTLLQHIPQIKLIEPDASYLVWLDFSELGMDPKALAKFLVEDAHMATNPGHWFGREGAGFARINIACPRSVLQQALSTLEQAVNQL